MDVESLKESFKDRLLYSVGKDRFSATDLDYYTSLAYAVRDRLIERWMHTQQTYYNQDVKRVYYLSMEFLMGRTLTNSLLNLGIKENAEQTLKELGFDLATLEKMEIDAGLGNGGLGRLAACFLDSLSTLRIPAYGYGIRYEYGIFNQYIVDGYQKELPDNWLRFGNPWEIARPEFLYPVRFYGRIHQFQDSKNVLHSAWVDTRDVMAMAYDVAIPGYNVNTVNTLRLWTAKSTQDFDLEDFNIGDYVGAVEQKNETEVISKVLYPNDQSKQGRELRLKQEYFFVSATLQDVIRRYAKHRKSYTELSDKVAIQLNDTHPAIAIPELMRLLVDEKNLPWEVAWDITVQTFGYTNHTILPEAIERWSVELFGKTLPRHLQIIYEINQRFLDFVSVCFPGEYDRRARMSIIEEGQSKQIQMAHLAIVGSHSVNGVSELHSDLLKTRLFKDFYELWPERFNNKTNGITQRRWLLKSNPGLSNLITEYIGEDWITDLYELKKIAPLVDDPEFCREWRAIKLENKKKLAEYIKMKNGVRVAPESMFDVQIKRMHEYKRQLLNILHVVALYNRILNNPEVDFVPRTIIFGGKSAPGYFMTKLIIKLINSVAHLINRNPIIGNKLKIIFIENYGVSLAEKIIPATDLSEQISTAGLEASGTGNMKFSLNGALTIGTLDGANIEIREEVGKENFFLFGLTAEEVAELKERGYNPMNYYRRSEELRQILDMISQGYFSPTKTDLFQPIVDSLLKEGDQYMLLADYADYVACQNRAADTYQDPDKWTRMSILNVSAMGKFSSDRTIREYARDIWNVHPLAVPDGINRHNP
ncbi:MAG: glycogen phosphorylase [Candidatus Cloacimonetes bacterium 4572_55]|nr:MAG: glycogen phosphorylase [Candidatus Cloacimonetes bacterium 4572_55]